MDAPPHSIKIYLTLISEICTFKFHFCLRIFVTKKFLNELILELSPYFDDFIWNELLYFLVRLKWQMTEKIMRTLTVPFSIYVCTCN